MTDDEDSGSWSQGRWVPPVYRWPKMSEEEFELVRKRQLQRAKIMAWLLGAFVLLLFLITLSKLGIIK